MFAPKPDIKKSESVKYEQDDAIVSITNAPTNNNQKDFYGRTNPL